MSLYVKRLLMVDDDVALCESMRDYLAERTDEYKFLGGVCTFSAAMNLFKDGMPDIVILDMMLGPGLDGSDLIVEFKKIEKELGFKTNLFVTSKSGVYENYCAKNHLIFMQKGENNPELMIKRIERFIDCSPASEPVIKIEITPKSRKERMEDFLWAAFSNVGAHTYTAYGDCVYIIPRVIEMVELGEASPMDRVYMEWGIQCKTSKDTIESRIRNMLKSVWSNSPMEALKQFYPPDIRKSTYPTPLPFINYYVKLLMRKYPKNIERS